MEDSSLLDFRRQVLDDCGTLEKVIRSVLAYNENPFHLEGPVPDFPLTDEAHVAAWEGYEKDSRDMGAFEALKLRFAQLRFPVRAGMSQKDAYRNATRKGRFEEADAYSPGLELHRPSELELDLCPTMAGRIPVLVARDRGDFVTLVRAFTERNEPETVPDSMGACIVKGLNNWDRVAAYRREWESSHEANEAAWAEEFRRLIPRKELYQDRFIILSRGPYSAVAAGDMGLDEEEWLDRSLVIRREHELTHYFTYRVFGVMRNNLLDELIADFVGLQRAFGRYSAEMALRFLGLESFPRYREGGRLENYRGNPPLSGEGLEVLACLAHRTAHNLETFGAERTGIMKDLGGAATVTFALAGLSLEELASSEMKARVERRLQ